MKIDLDYVYYRESLQLSLNARRPLDAAAFALRQGSASAGGHLVVDEQAHLAILRRVLDPAPRVDLVLAVPLPSFMIDYGNSE